MVFRWGIFPTQAIPLIFFKSLKPAGPAGSDFNETIFILTQNKRDTTEAPLLKVQLKYQKQAITPQLAPE